ncbi:MAG: hypothetical protein AAGC70_09975 [Pseudomonadota bacterium]
MDGYSQSQGPVASRNAGGAKPKADQSAQVDLVIQRLADKLTSVLQEERQALAERDDAKIGMIVTRKNQLTLELSRVSASLDDTQPSDAAIESLQKIREGLADNHRLLGLHVEALREITSLVARVVQTSQSDGTYSELSAQR